MIELEKRGVTTSGWVDSGFVEDAKLSAMVFGAKGGTTIAVLPGPSALIPPEKLREQVGEAIDKVIENLTTPLKIDKVKTEEPKTEQTAEIITIEGVDQIEAIDKMVRHFLDEGWSDGFPLVPPTPTAVKEMLAGTKLKPDDVVSILEPGNGVATVEKIAINAVMAGCRPEHMPVVIAAVRCIGDPRMFLRTNAMSTGANAPVIIVNGPITKKLKINSKTCAMSPASASYANMVIGRALRLMIMNIGHGYCGSGCMSTIGSPLNISCCCAENEEDSPWEPYHVEKGYDKDTSTITVMFVFNMISIMDMQSFTAEELAWGYAKLVAQPDMITGRWLIGHIKNPLDPTKRMKNEHLMLLCPGHAKILARDGWTKDTLRQYLFKNARLNFETLMTGKEIKGIEDTFPQLMDLKEHPEVKLPVVDRPDCFEIAVVGGPGTGSYESLK